MPFSEADLSRILVLLYGSGVASLAWLAKCLTDEKPTTIRRAVGGMLAAGIAAFSFSSTIGDVVSLRATYILGVSGVVGFIGGDALELMGRHLRKRLEKGDEVEGG